MLRGPMPRDLSRLPKAHLHLHLEGSARASTIAEFGRREGIDLTGLSKPCDLATFMQRYWNVVGVIKYPADLERICRELVEDEAKAGVVHLEPMFAPHDFATRFGMTPEAVFQLMDAAFQTAARVHDVSVSYLLGVDRARSLADIREVADFAVAHTSRRVVGFGYGGDESVRTATELAPVCQIILDAGMALVVHAGEVLGADTVREAVEVLRPTRVAHGIRAVDDTAVLDLIAARHLTLDLAPTSNVFTGAVPSLALFPLRTFLQHGIRVTLNADDQLFFGASILNEYDNARRHQGLDDVALAAIATTSIEASRAPEAVKRAAIANINAWVRGVSGPAIGQ